MKHLSNLVVAVGTMIRSIGEVMYRYEKLKDSKEVEKLWKEDEKLSSTTVRCDSPPDKKEGDDTV